MGLRRSASLFVARRCGQWLLAVGMLSTAHPADEAMKARLWVEAEKTRLVLETPAPLTYSISDLESPPRLVIDVASEEGVSTVHGADISAAQNYLKGVRSGHPKESVWRVVFDLSAAVNYRVRRFEPVSHFAHRLVIDIEPTNPPDPLLALLEALEGEADPFLVLVDPGHGGEDPGAVSANNNYEKNVVLAISKKLAREINRRAGMKALLTRDNDRFIKLFNRVHTAHRLQADIFVSIHADSVKSKTARGSSVFVLSKKGATTPGARRLAQSANLSDLIGGESNHYDAALDSVLREFSKDGKERASYLLAQLILNNIKKINTLHSERVEAAGFAVLKSPSVPSVLVETAFISHPEEEKKLHDQAYQERMARAIADAVEQYKNEFHIE